MRFMEVEKATVDDMATMPPVIARPRSAKHVLATFNAGLTSIGEMAGYDSSYRKSSARDGFQFLTSITLLVY